MWQLMIAYFLIAACLTITIGLIIFTEYKLRKAILIILLWPLWLLPLFLYIIVAFLLALIKNLKVEKAFEELDKVLKEWKTYQFLENFMAEE